MRYSPDHNSCEIIGDPDLYGVGVRVGLFLQWAAILLAILLVPGDAISAFISVIVLNLSIFVSFFSNAIGNELGKLLSFLELWIVAKETFVLDLGLLPASFWIYGYRERFRPLWCITMIMYSLMLFALVYLIAAEQASVQRKGCEDIVKHDNKGIREGWVIYPTLNGLLALGLCLWNLWLYYSRQSRLRAHGHGRLHFLSRRYGDWESQLNLIQSFVLLFAVVDGVYAISILETSLKQHKVSTATESFSSTSQLIPFLCGLLNLLYVFWRSFKTGLATRPLTSWCYEMRIALDYLLHQSKVSSQAICIRLSQRRFNGNRNSSWNLSTP